jgi:3-methyladenine DNA glycosylase/8-oxoguanine DNA glycosylase
MSKAAPVLRLPRTALPHLRSADPALSLVIKRVGPFGLQAGNPEGPLCALVRSIVYQQLSGKAAGTIYGRFRALFEAPAGRFPTPEQILAVPDAALRGCGLSSQKLGYVRDLCQNVDAGTLQLDRLPDLADEDVIAQLTRVKGVGRWSAQMFLIFYLGRLDVWPDADLGIRSAVRIMHGHAELPPSKKVAELAARYSPYASVASWYLWRLLDLPKEEREELFSAS